MNPYQKRRERGRPPGRTYPEIIPVRLAKETLAAIDAWATHQNEKGISRSEAIRRLLDEALDGHRKLDAGTARAVQEALVALERAIAALRRLAQ